MSLRYDIFNKNKYESHRLVYDSIEKESRVLDVGCATGYFARELMRKDCEVWGLDSDKDALKKAEKFNKKSYQVDLDTCTKLPSLPSKYFDYVLLLDVIEHIKFPEQIIKILKSHLKSDGIIIISTPNIAHASVRWELIKGRFDYTDTGIMDRTHLHFYTKSTLAKLLAKMGLVIEKILPTNGMCKVPFLCKFTDRLTEEYQYRIASAFPELFAYQFVVFAKVSKKVR